MLRKIWPATGAVFIAVAVIGALLALKSPTAAEDNRAQFLPTDPEPLIVETATGAKKFTIEIADDPSERERGLMFRTEMADDHGMLFVFEDQREVGFWMENTPMPLDILFIAQDGSIKAIKKGEPFSQALISPGQPVRFVLELKDGIADANGIAAGDKMKHRAIAQAPGPAQPVNE